MTAKKRRPFQNHGRGKLVEYLGNNKALFECPAGHQVRMNLMPHSPIGTVPCEEMLRFTAKRWQNTGVNIFCTKCAKEIDALQRNVNRLEVRLNARR